MCDARPQCHSWQKKKAPLSCTALTMGFHASTCSEVCTPGVLGYLKEGARQVGRKDETVEGHVAQLMERVGYVLPRLIPLSGMHAQIIGVISHKE